MVKKINLVILIGLMAGFFSCQKAAEVQSGSNSSLISQEDLDAAQKITSFIDRMHTPSLLKSGELVPLDEALWNLEASMNYLFADVPEKYEAVQADSLTFTLPVSGDYSSGIDLSELYQALHDSVQLYSRNGDAWQILAIAVSLTEQRSQEADIVATVIRVLAPSIGGGPMFNSYDWWYAGELKGICSGPNAGKYRGERDAATETQRLFLLGMPKLYALHGSIYYTDVVEYSFAGSELDNPDWDHTDPYLQYMLYCGPRTYGEACLPPYALNFYLTNLRNFINNEWKPAGKHFMTLLYRYEYQIGIKDNAGYFIERHAGEVEYGIPHARPGSGYEM